MEVQKAHASVAQTRDIERRFLDFLQSGATTAAKDFICRQLGVIGSEASVPVLAAMLNDAGTADLGRYALERIPGPAVDRALREALAKSSGRPRIGIVNTLGRRRDAASVTALAGLISADATTAGAALAALAEIADPGAVKALSEALVKSAGALRLTAAEAGLKAADNLVERGRKSEALPIYRQLYAAGESLEIRAGALRGLAASDPRPEPVLVEALRGNDAVVQAAAVRALAPSSAKLLLSEMPRLSEAAQVRILGTLAERRDASFLPAFSSAIRSSAKPVRLAALEAVGMAGDASSVALLAAIAAGDDEAERTAARAGLASLSGKGVDQKLVQGLEGGDLKTRLEMIRAVGVRGTAAAAPVLMQMARDDNNDIRRESLAALRNTAQPGDVAGLAALVATPARPGDRAEAARALGVVLRRSDSSRVEEAVKVYASAADPGARSALLQVMGTGGNPQALEALRSALKEDNPDVKRAAILGLTEWPDGTPIPDLLQAARTASNPAHQVLALRGAIRLIGIPEPGRPPRESVKLLAEAMSLARQAEEKRAVLAMLPRYPVEESLALATASLNDSQVGAEAKSAVARLERTLKR